MPSLEKENKIKNVKGAGTLEASASVAPRNSVPVQASRPPGLLGSLSCAWSCIQPPGGPTVTLPEPLTARADSRGICFSVGSLRLGKA